MQVYDLEPNVLKLNYVLEIPKFYLILQANNRHLQLAQATKCALERTHLCIAHGSSDQKRFADHLSNQSCAQANCLVTCFILSNLPKELAVSNNSVKLSSVTVTATATATVTEISVSSNSWNYCLTFKRKTKLRGVCLDSVFEKPTFVPYAFGVEEFFPLGLYCDKV
ncbi:hypothetical protein CsSME_00034156 [Camellia sinensis var. sinensis]